MEDIGVAILKGFQVRLLLYFTIGGSLSFFIYFICKQQQVFYKIQSLSHKWKDVRREVKYSILSLFVFSILGYVLFVLINQEYTLMYSGEESKWTPYYFLSIFLAIAIHDVYFYVTHRMLHTRWLMRHVHKVHHQSHDPTLWAAFSFHPIEAMINFGVFFVLVFCLPLHQSILFYFFLVNTSNNILGHCGYEIFPKNFTRHWLGKWITTSTHHNMHHKHARGNYGLYFTWLDKILQTEHPQYHDSYKKVVSKRKTIKNSIKH